MKRLFALALGVALSFGGCKCRSTDTAAKEKEPEAPPNSTFWQLHDDSMLNVRIEPWPPAGLQTRVIAEATLGDWSDDTNYTAAVRYRIGTSGPWMAMSKGTADADGTIPFSSEILLPSGSTELQFQVVPTGRGDAVELTGWTINPP